MFMDTITFNRRERRYELVDVETGELHYFPPGPAGKAQAFRQAVELFAPDLFAAAIGFIAENPYLERRTWNAVNAVLSGAVHILPELENTNILARVSSSDGLGAYNIRNVQGLYSCECEDWQSLNAPMTQSGQRYCYHIISKELNLLTQEQPY